MEPEVETLTVTLTERDKRDLKVLAAVRGETMRGIVRGLIRDAVAGTEVRREPVTR
jgi:hypothetical protein